MSINGEEEKLAVKAFGKMRGKKWAEMFFWLILLALVIYFNYRSIPSGTQANLLTETNTAADMPKTANVPKEIPKDAVDLVTISRVVDGDTFYYEENGLKGEVRMLGIDTPETVDPRKPVQCFGKEASDETKQLLEGKTAILKKDTVGDDLDKYKRQLRYVYLTNGTFINEYLVAEGYAHATPQYKFDLKDHFVDLENQARIAEKGLWNPKVCP